MSTATTATPTIRALCGLDLPAILASVLGLVFLAAMALWNPLKIEQQYKAAASEALESGDYETALVAGQRLFSLNGETRNEAVLILARAKLAMGRENDASALLDLVAPSDKPVFAPAHLFVARRLMDPANATNRNEQAIVTQLQNVLTLDPSSFEAHDALAAIAVRRKNWLEARKHLEFLVAKQPEAMFQLAAIARSLSDTAAVTSWNEKALTHYEKRFTESSPVSQPDRVYFAEALLQSGRFEEALRVLGTQPEAETNADSARRLAVVYRAWANDIAAKEPGSLARRADELALSLAFGANPNQRAALQIVESALLDHPNDPGLAATRLKISPPRE